MRISVILLVLAMSSGSAFAVDGANLPGHDYANFNAPSAFVCRTTCGGESRCQAYTWVKPGIQGPSGHCWLKHTQPEYREGCMLQLRSAQFHLQTISRAEDKINRPGSDFKNFQTNSWNTCARPPVPRGRLRVLDLCPPGRARANRPLLAEEHSRASGSRREHDFRCKVQTCIGADRPRLISLTRPPIGALRKGFHDVPRKNCTVAMPDRRRAELRPMARLRSRRSRQRACHCKQARTRRSDRQLLSRGCSRSGQRADASSAWPVAGVQVNQAYRAGWLNIYLIDAPASAGERLVRRRGRAQLHRGQSARRRTRR